MGKQWTVNEWLEDEVTYTGPAKAHFSNPAGVLNGPATARFGADGRGEVTFTVGTGPSSVEGVSGTVGFLSGQPAPDGRAAGSYTVDSKNPCTEVRIDTGDGEWVSATDHVPFDLHMAVGTANTVRLSFHPSRSVYTPADAEPATHWTLPLVNFLTRFPPRFGGYPVDVLTSPLLFRLPPTCLVGVPFDDWPTTDQASACGVAAIPFDHDGKCAFIQPLPDYSALRARLESGDGTGLVTAAMVGPTSDRPTAGVSALDWVPTELLTVLGMATGVAAGIPWLELRGGRGELCSRVHARYGSSTYSRSRELISSGAGSLSLLLSKAPNSGYWAETWLDAAMVRLNRSGRNGEYREMGLVSIFLALDSILVGLGLKKAQKAGMCTEPTRLEVKRIIRAARKELDALSLTTQQDDQYRRIVAGHVSGAGTIRPSYGNCIERLLKRFDLPDAAIVAGYLASHSKPYGKSWPKALENLRGAAVHDGYVDFGDDTWPRDDVEDMYEHLHDITARVLLKLLGYDGEYQPTVAEWRGGKPLDWVTPSTTAEELGYGRAR